MEMRIPTNNGGKPSLKRGSIMKKIRLRVRIRERAVGRPFFRPPIRTKQRKKKRMRSKRNLSLIWLTKEREDIPPLGVGVTWTRTLSPG